MRAAATGHLQTPSSLTDLFDRAGRERTPVVALFSRDGCPWCEAIRRDQLVHLARDARAQGVMVVEFDVADDRPFATGGATDREPGNRQKGKRATPPPAGRKADRQSARDPNPEAGEPAALARIRTAESPAALARRLGIRAVPTVVFLGGDEELAERLVGYQSPDFYGAYLEQRIADARRRMQTAP